VQQNSAAKWLFTGLTSAVSYSLVVNAIGTAGPSGWSNPASQFLDNLHRQTFQSTSAPRFTRRAFVFTNLTGPLNDD
jgi:hypothetical protein